MDDWEVWSDRFGRDWCWCLMAVESMAARGYVLVALAGEGLKRDGGVMTKMWDIQEHLGIQTLSQLVKPSSASIPAQPSSHPYRDITLHLPHDLS